jgi:hypothetical protein
VGVVSLKGNMADEVEMISVTIHPNKVLQHIAQQIDEEMELPTGDIAGPPPCSQRLAARAVIALSDFGLLDGSYYNVVRAAREELKNGQ